MIENENLINTHNGAGFIVTKTSQVCQFDDTQSKPDAATITFEDDAVYHNLDTEITCWFGDNEDCDYFTIAKEFEVDDKSHTVDEKTATAIANHLQFKGDVRESKSGKSWRVYKNRISNSFDLSAITS